MSRSKKNRTEDEFCVHHGRDGCIFFISPMIIMLVAGIVAFPLAGLWWMSLLNWPLLILFISIVYASIGDTMTINKEGIHWSYPRNKERNFSVPWEDVIEIYYVASFNPTPTYIRFRKGNDICEWEFHVTYRTKTNKALAKYGFQMQKRKP